MKKLLTVTTSLCLFFSIILQTSQTQAQELSYPFDINGVDIDRSYTKQQMMNFFGNPNEYEAMYYDDTDSFIEIYYFGINYFYCENGYFSTIIIEDTKFSFFNGYLKVGDNVSKLNKFTNKEIFRLSNHPNEATINGIACDMYRLLIYDNSMEIYYDKNNIIKKIIYNVPN